MIRGRWKNPLKRRDQLYIIAEILAIAKKGVLKTQIMYRANLSFTQLNDYLGLLLEMGLIEAINKGEKIHYRTTEKGLHFIQDYKKITSLLNREGEWGISQWRF